MALEPTEEQWMQVTMLLDPDRSWPQAGADAYRVWDLIRDIVLEAAAGEASCTCSDPRCMVTTEVQRRIRAMKGGGAGEGG